MQLHPLHDVTRQSRVGVCWAFTALLRQRRSGDERTRCFVRAGRGFENAGMAALEALRTVFPACFGRIHAYCASGAS